MAGDNFRHASKFPPGLVGPGDDRERSRWAVRVAVPFALFTCVTFSARAQDTAQVPASADAQASVEGMRPEHLWSSGYPTLVVGDTVSIFTAPAR